MAELRRAFLALGAVAVVGAACDFGGSVGEGTSIRTLDDGGATLTGSARRVEGPVNGSTGYEVGPGAGGVLVQGDVILLRGTGTYEACGDVADGGACTSRAAPSEYTWIPNPGAMRVGDDGSTLQIADAASPTPVTCSAARR